MSTGVLRTGRVQDTADEELYRVAASGDTPDVLAEIYQAHINMAVWNRELCASVEEPLPEFLSGNPGFTFATTLTPENASQHLARALGETLAALRADIADLVDMFCCLFDLNSAGVRLAVLSRAMCPRFHVDKVPCRLVTTYSGVATEWLPHACVNRARLGRGGDGLSDLEAGLYAHEYAVQELSSGDVALLKGELWDGNEGAGLVHRSPDVSAGLSRLVLTLDIAS